MHPEEKDAVRNYFTGEVVREVKMGPPVGSYTVSGIFAGDSVDNDYIFLYDRGAVRRAKHQPSAIQDIPFAPQPEALNAAPFSLWQAALELHAGRLYRPFLGKWGTELFIFLLGLASVIVLVTGLRRRSKSKPHPKHNQ